MNIFVLDSCPVQAARMACDKHVVKMTLETAQMLSCVAIDRGVVSPYRATHRNHPCTKWVALSSDNYSWAWEHGMALAREYTFRYGKTHASQRVIESLRSVSGLLPRGVGLTPHAQAMPEVYRRPGDAVTAYRLFYRAEKARFAKWEKGREMPAFFILDTNQHLG